MRNWAPSVNLAKNSGLTMILDGVQTFEKKEYRKKETVPGENVHCVHRVPNNVCGSDFIMLSSFRQLYQHIRKKSKFLYNLYCSFLCEVSFKLTSHQETINYIGINFTYVHAGKVEGMKRAS